VSRQWSKNGCLKQASGSDSDLIRRFRILRSAHAELNLAEDKEIRVLLHRHPKILLKQKREALIGEQMGAARNKPIPTGRTSRKEYLELINVQ
jgi:hypothetical protein